MADNAKTGNFGLDKFGAGIPGSITSSGGKFSSIDRDAIDSILAAVVGHTHRDAIARLGDPVTAPTLSLDTTTGSLAASTTYFYRTSYIDKYGLESAASTEVSITTPDPVLEPGLPVLTIQSGGTLAVGNTYYAFSALASGSETDLGPAALINVSTGYQTVAVTVPPVPAGATQLSVWRQGQLETGFTRIGTIATSVVTFTDNGSVPPVQYPQDPTNMPAGTNLTSRTNTITVTVSDSSVVGAYPSAVKAWRVYRSTQSGVYSSQSLLAEVRTTTGGVGTGLVTTYVDDGTGTLSTGLPLDISQTLNMTANTSLTFTGIQSADYTSVGWEIVRFNATAASRTLHLPQGAADGVQVAMYLSATGSGHTASVVAGSGDTIDSLATTSINSAGNAVFYQKFGTVWYQVANIVNLSGFLSTAGGTMTGTLNGTEITANDIQVGTSTEDLGGGVGVIGIHTTTTPTTNPASGNVVLFSNAGVLSYLDHSGVIHPLDGSSGLPLTGGTLSGVLNGTDITANNYQVGTSTEDLGGGNGVISIHTVANPSTNPASGNVIIYSNAGILSWKDSSGVVHSLDDTTFEKISHKGAASGYASLDSGTKVPIAQLPTGTSSSTVAIGNDSRITGAEQTSNKNVANGYAGLDGSGLLSASQLPALALNTVYSVASQAAMLALAANQGDVAVRSDTSPPSTFMLKNTPASTLGNWVQISVDASLITSVFGRTGAVVATTGDYTAAQVTNAADTSSSSTQTFTGKLSSPAHIASGLTGATAASRYVGGTTGGAPASGTFAVGDFIIDQTGKLFVCTGAGTPGTWTQTGAVSSFNSRTGAVVPTSGDYTAAQVTNAADKSSASAQTFTGNLSAPVHIASGLTGATAASRYVGATASGAPASGTFLTGDWIVDQTSKIWVCTAGGTPGTWTQTTASNGGVTSFNSRTGAIAPTSGDYTAAQVTNAADKSSGSQQTFTSNISAPAHIASGLTGATSSSRYVGATTTGAPSSGTFALGDYAIAQDGVMWICTTAGSPGTWKSAASLMIPLTQKGAASGVAPLDVSGLVPIANLPVGTSSTQVAAGNDSRITGALQKSGGTMTGELNMFSSASEATLSAEQITATNDRTFAGAGNWTGTNWSVSGGTFTHTAGVNVASLANTNLVAAPVAGTNYQLTFDLTTTTVGLITPSFGGISSALFTATLSPATPSAGFMTVTRSTGSFITDGFALGQNVNFSGFANPVNNGTFQINAITATVLTLIDLAGTISETSRPNVGAATTTGITLGQTVGTLPSQTQIINATGNGPLSFTPDANWVGSIDNISIKIVTPSTPAATLENSDATVGVELRSGGSSGGAPMQDTYFGYQAGLVAQAGTGFNTGVGAYSCASITTGVSNTGIGNVSLASTTTGINNNAIGDNALAANTTGSQNNAIGCAALGAAIYSNDNVAIGDNALQSLQAGNQNTAIGSQALTSPNLAIPAYTGNVAIGYSAGYWESASNHLWIDNQQRADLATSKTTSLVYGVFAATAVNQVFTINAQVGINSVPNAWLTLPAGTATAGQAPLRLTAGTNLTTPVAGAIEYDGNVLYATPNATSKRAIIPSVLFTSTVTDFTGSNSTTAQNVFASGGASLTVAGSTTYEIEGIYHIHTTGTASHTLALGFAGTATFTSFGAAYSTTNAATEVLGSEQTIWVTTAAQTIVTTATATATHHTIRIKGIARINASGTFIPQYQWGTTAPGTAGVTLANSYLKLTPIGSGSVQSVGAWT